MSLPRQILPGRFYLVTRRCTQRQFLLRPDRITNNAFLYCVAEAAIRFNIQIILPVAMSNHYHVVLYDPDGNLPLFTEHFHKMLAKCLNARWGRWENFWSSEQVSVVHLVNRAAILDKLVYVATNPVKAHLVDRARRWPGVNGLQKLLAHRPLRACRPRHFFCANGTMPAEVTLELVVPAVLDDPELLLQQLCAQVKSVESDVAEALLRAGKRIVGCRVVRTQLWRDAPSSRPARRGLRPTLAVRDTFTRLEAIHGRREFLSAYRMARDRWLEGDPAACFPPGTYWLRRFANVHVAN